MSKASAAATISGVAIRFLVVVVDVVVIDTYPPPPPTPPADIPPPTAAAVGPPTHVPLVPVVTVGLAACMGGPVGLVGTPPARGGERGSPGGNPPLPLSTIND